MIRWRLLSAIFRFRTDVHEKLLWAWSIEVGVTKGFSHMTQQSHLFLCRNSDSESFGLSTKLLLTSRVDGNGYFTSAEYDLFILLTSALPFGTQYYSRYLTRFLIYIGRFMIFIHVELATGSHHFYIWYAGGCYHYIRIKRHWKVIFHITLHIITHLVPNLTLIVLMQLALMEIHYIIISYVSNDRSSSITRVRSCFERLVVFNVYDFFVGFHPDPNNGCTWTKKFSHWQS